MALDTEGLLSLGRRGVKAGAGRTDALAPPDAFMLLVVFASCVASLVGKGRPITLRRDSSGESCDASLGFCSATRSRRRCAALEEGDNSEVERAWVLLWPNEVMDRICEAVSVPPRSALRRPRAGRVNGDGEPDCKL